MSVNDVGGFRVQAVGAGRRRNHGLDRHRSLPSDVFGVIFGVVSSSMVSDNTPALVRVPGTVGAITGHHGVEHERFHADVIVRFPAPRVRRQRSYHSLIIDVERPCQPHSPPNRPCRSASTRPSRSSEASMASPSSSTTINNTMMVSPSVHRRGLRDKGLIPVIVDHHHLNRR